MNSERFFNAVSLMREHQKQYENMSLENVSQEEKYTRYKNKMFFERVIDDEIERVTRIMTERAAR